MTDLPRTPEARRQSLREWETLMRRYPASTGMVVWQVLSVLAGNITIAWLVANQRMSPLELVLLVAIEAVLLIGIAMLHAHLLPKEAIQKNPMGLRERLGTFAFGLFWLAAVYSLVLGLMVPQGAEVQRLLADPVAFLLGSNLKWPLAITLLGAGVDALQDHAHFRKHGGTFVSTPGMQGAARWLTLFLGGIPFFMPMVAVVGGLVFLGKQAAEFVKRRGSDNREALALTLMAPVMIFGFFGTFAWLVQTDVSGWAVGYATAKFAAEVLIVCLPLIAKQAHAEESAGIYRVKGKKVKLP